MAGKKKRKGFRAQSEQVPHRVFSRRAHARQGKAITSFQATLPPAESDLAAQVFKDPYLFDFLGTADPFHDEGCVHHGVEGGSIVKAACIMDTNREP